MDISNIINTEFPLDVNVLAYLNQPIREIIYKFVHKTDKKEKLEYVKAQIDINEFNVKFWNVIWYDTKINFKIGPESKFYLLLPKDKTIKLEYHLIPAEIHNGVILEQPIYFKFFDHLPVIIDGQKCLLHDIYRINPAHELDEEESMKN